MQVGEVVKVRRNAELLNKLLGTNYKQWYKSYKRIDAKTMIWMVLTRRIVFEITNFGYKFHGVYEFDAEKSNLKHRELVRISDTYNF